MFRLYFAIPSSRRCDKLSYCLFPTSLNTFEHGVSSTGDSDHFALHLFHRSSYYRSELVIKCPGVNAATLVNRYQLRGRAPPTLVGHALRLCRQAALPSDEHDPSESCRQGPPASPGKQRSRRTGTDRAPAGRRRTAG